MGWKSILSSPKVKRKVKKVMGEWKKGKLRSGSKKGPKVPKNRPDVAKAIAVSESKKAVGAKS
jgi:hypothetical protein